MKSNFSDLKLIGQFNRGFIIGVLDGSLLFILDQHACDERRNLEHYEKTLKVECQQLIKPLISCVSKHQASLILKYDNIFEQNGMRVQLAKAALDNPQKHMVPVRIVAMPQSEGI